MTKFLTLNIWNSMADKTPKNESPKKSEPQPSYILLKPVIENVDSLNKKALMKAHKENYINICKKG